MKKRDFAFTADVVITVPSAVVVALGPSNRADADKVHDALWGALVAWCEAHGATFGGGTDVRELDENGDPVQGLPEERRPDPPPDEDAWAYTPEHRARVAEAMADVEAGNVLHLTEDELRAHIGLPPAAEDAEEEDAQHPLHGAAAASRPS